MDVRGYHLVSVLDANSEEGFATTVTAADGTVKGPFVTVLEAVLCAHDWADSDAKAKLRKVDPASPAVNRTASESVTEHVERPVDNPTVVMAERKTT